MSNRTTSTTWSVPVFLRPAARRSPEATANLVTKAERQRGSWGKWLLHNYLFIRIRCCGRTASHGLSYPYLRWVFSPLWQR